MGVEVGRYPDNVKSTEHIRRNDNLLTPRSLASNNARSSYSTGSLTVIEVIVLVQRVFLRGSSSEW